MEQSAGKPIRCRAAVSKAPGQPLEMEEVEVAPPRAHEVRVKIICTSLCHTDVTFWRMKDFPAMYPSILGHEAVGVGEHVQEVAAGDTVVPVFLPQCGECDDCLSARSNICSVLTYRPGLMPRDGTTRFSLAATGEPVHTFLSVSSFAEYTVVDVGHVVKLAVGSAPALPPEKACLLSCGVATGVGAAWKVAAVEAGSTVAVFGLGTVGLAVAQGSKMRGAKRIIGVDLNPDKLDIAKRLGITDFVNPNETGGKTVSEVITEMTASNASAPLHSWRKPSKALGRAGGRRSSWARTPARRPSAYRRRTSSGGGRSPARSSAGSSPRTTSPCWRTSTWTRSWSWTSSSRTSWASTT